MTELSHPVHIEPSTAAAAAPDDPGGVLSLAESATDLRSPGARATAHGRESVALDEALSPEDVAALSTRQLRVMVNQTYRLMDTDYPPASAIDRYEMIVEELEHRAQQAADRGTDSESVHQVKETFRDNSLYCRFELIIDGTIAAYMKYTMSGAQIVLTDGVEQPGFWDQGIDATLMRHVVLNAHKRRLSLVPRCPMAFTFLTENPQYQALVNRPLTSQPVR